MTGPEHYREAERLLAEDENIREGGGDPGDMLIAAQVHATLALAAATALHEPGRSPARSTIYEWADWKRAAGVVAPQEDEA